MFLTTHLRPVGCWLLCLCLSWASLSAAEKDARPLLLTDFEQADALKMQAGDVTAKVVRGKQSQQLEISTAEKDAYPGVLLLPPQGKWDLASYDGVSVEITNPGDHAIRVLMSMNNPGADGRKHCNTEGLDVGPKKRATLTVPFGMWHGNANHPIDQANIVSVRVFLEQPKGARVFTIDNLQAVKIEKVNLESLLASPFLQSLQPPFKQGINLGNALDGPEEGAWGVKLEESYFAKIAEAGFDTIRLPVRWSAHTQTETPYKIDETFAQRVDWAIEQALSRKLKIIVNIHHYDELLTQPVTEKPRFLAMWKQIATRYQNRSADLVFEVYNEPHPPITADQWNELNAAGLQVIRQTNPQRLVMVGPVAWNGISALPLLELPEADRNLIVTYHYYDPYLFTHQSADFASPDARATKNRPWTGTPEEQAAVRRSFDAALAWSVKHQRPLFMGEFGAYHKADLESRIRWTRFVAEEARRRKIGYAYWEFCSGFGVYDAKTEQWQEKLKDALLLK
jgi:endoglucanase